MRTGKEAAKRYTRKGFTEKQAKVSHLFSQFPNKGREKKTIGIWIAISDSHLVAQVALIV